MNEWDRTCTRVPLQGTLQAERYKAEYPSGTRIMLLGMGQDIHRVNDNTKGTVMVVDDIGTLHCRFDNGRSLGLIPSEDSFRKLTKEELAEEQEEDMDNGMDEDGPSMRM